MLQILYAKPLVKVFFLFCLSNAIWSQEFGVFGRVVDSNNQPVSFANILLTRAADSSYVAGTSTDDNGGFSIIPLEQNTYILSVSFIGYASVSEVFLLDKDIDFQTIILEENSESLDEISIVAKKPTITKKPDRLTFNIENTALTEGSTLQVLKSTPGVIVTEGSVNVKSAAATVYINNRRVQLTDSELIQLLENAPAEAIKSVEVITNPPASYDASSGVIVNINMSKNLVAGYRGSLQGNYTQGVYPRYNVVTSHYFKNNKLSFNINYNFNKKKINRENLGVVNYLDDLNTIDEVWTSMIDRNTRSETHSLNLNLDYTINKNNEISLSATGLYTPYFSYSIFNNTVITDPSNEFLERFTADNTSRDNKYNLGLDLDYRLSFLNGSTLALNAHFTQYDYTRDQNVFSEFFDMDNNFDADSEFNTKANQKTKIYNAKLDYNAALNDENASLDFGVKLSNIQTDSDITKIDIIEGNPILDPLNSDIYIYDEKVFAGYVNYSKSWNNWDLSIGLRAEQTNIEGQSLSLNETNNQDYLELFPNLSISHDISDGVSVYGNYKRSITRPNYTNLNPFTFFLNENTVVVGNPFLQPTFKDHFVVGTSFLKYFTVEAYYINYDGAIQELPRQDNDTNIIAYVPINLDKTVDFGFDLLVDFYLTDWWSVFAVTSFYNITEETKFGDDFISLSQWSNVSILSNNLYLLKDNSLSVSFNVTYANKNLQGLKFINTRVFSDLAISKTIWNDRGVISLSVEDLFNEQDEVSTVEYLNQSSSVFTNLDNRLIKVGLKYKFGNTKLISNERTLEVEERNRISEGG